MTGVAGDRRLTGFMTVHTPFHLHGLLSGNARFCQHVAVAAFAIHVGGGMLGVAEEDKIRNFVDALRQNLAGDIDVTHFAVVDCREAGKVAAGGALVA